MLCITTFNLRVRNVKALYGCRPSFYQQACALGLCLSLFDLNLCVGVFGLVWFEMCVHTARRVVELSIGASSLLRRRVLVDKLCAWSG